MKLWVINNTKFGYKNNSKEWLNISIDYFNNQFIPFLQKNSNEGDKIIHLGNIFNTTETINVTTLLTVLDLFKKLAKIRPVIIVNGYNEKNGITEIFQNINNISIINDVEEIEGCKIISNKNPIEYITNNETVVLTNTDVDIEVLNNIKNILFVCGYYDNKKEKENIIHVGAPYQFEKTEPDKGFYVIDVKTKKYKFIKNTHSPTFNTIVITDISQIENIDSDFVNKNFVNVVIDKSLIEDKKVKIDMLLSKYNFKSITYTNDVQNIEIIDNNTLDIEEIIRDKIKDDKDLLTEFEKIIKIFKEKYL